MSERRDSLDYLLSCQVCFEDFEENGNHVPRILPCSHTLCHECIGQMIRQNRIECPFCRKKHEAMEDYKKSFPQNKYILINIKRKCAKKQDEVSTTGTCEEHGKDLILFCKKTRMQQTNLPEMYDEKSFWT